MIISLAINKLSNDGTSFTLTTDKYELPIPRTRPRRRIKGIVRPGRHSRSPSLHVPRTDRALDLIRTCQLIYIVIANMFFVENVLKKIA